MKWADFITVVVATFLAVIAVNDGLFAKGKEERYKPPVGIVTPETNDRFDTRINELIRSGFVFKHPAPGLMAKLLHTNTVVDTLGLTIYDYSYNNINGRMLTRIFGGAFDGVHLVYMKRADLNSVRSANYRYYSYAASGFLGEFTPTPGLRTGWARVADGPLHNGIYVHHGGGTHLRIDDGEASFTFTYENPVDPNGNFPGIWVHGDTIIVTTTPSGTFTPGKTFVSINGGISFVEIGFPQPPTMSYEWGNAETWPVLNPINNQQIGFVNLERNNQNPPSGGLVYSVSTDLSVGTNWTSQSIYNFGDILTNSTGDYYYDPGIGIGTDHYNFEYSDNGIFHLVFDGAGVQFVQATGENYPIHPVVYWNSAQQQLIELTSDVVARNPALGNSIETLFPGWGKGNSYAHIAVGPNGVLAVIWQQPELIDSTTLNLITGTSGGNQITYYATDIFCAVSSDNGLTWSEPFKVGGLDGESDVYPSIARDIEVDAFGNYFIHFIYFWDTNPGSSVLSQTDPSLCAWVYNKFNITPYLFTSIPKILSVDPDSAFTGQTLSVSILGENTVFQQDSLLTNTVWLSNSSEMIQATNVNAISPTALTAQFTIPDTANLGLWDVNVLQVGGAGTVSLLNGFKIYERIIDSLSLGAATRYAFPGDTVNIPLNVAIPPDSFYSSVEIFLTGFQGQLDFLDVITSGTLIGNAGWSLQFNNTDSVLTIAAAGSNDITGSGDLLVLKMAVPDTTPVGFVPISLDSAVFNTGATYVRLTSGGINILLPKPGDVDHNDLIQAFDASLILKYLVGLIQLSPTQRSNANVSNDTTISALDAELVLEYVVGLIDTLPYDTTIIPLGTMLMQDGVFQPGEAVMVPLYLEGGVHIHGFEMELAYDPSQLEFIEVIWGDSLGEVIKTTNTVQTGQIKIAGAGKIPENESQIFAVLKFNVNPAFDGETIKIVLTKLRFNEEKQQRDVTHALLSRVTDIKHNDSNIPATFHLAQNFPNPFNPSTKIRYGIPKDIHISLEVYDINGRKVATLLDTQQRAGWHIVEWRGVNDDGSKVSSGIYLVRMKAGSFTFVRKMILLK